MQTAVELPDSLYDQARRAATGQGISIEKFITGAIEEKLRAGQPAKVKAARVRLPLVPSIDPGSQQLSAERVAELLGEDDAP